jgi:glycosyltransferase involved in cell wall biosynthesis
MRISKFVKHRKENKKSKSKTDKALPFDAAWYLKKYPDVLSAGVDPFEHYLEYGKTEGRQPFDNANLPKEATDSQFLNINSAGSSLDQMNDPATEESARSIELAEDAQLVLSSGYFDPTWYLRKYNDLNPDWMGALAHFMRHGAFEGRSPGPNFDSGWYLAQNRDLRGGHLNPLLHYLKHGMREGRKPTPPPGLLDIAKNTVDSISDLDIALSSHFFDSDMKSLHIADGSITGKTIDCLRSIIGKLSGVPDCLVVLPWLIHGGADLVAINIVRVLSKRFGPGSVLVVVLDYERLDAIEWLPFGIDHILVDEEVVGMTFQEKVTFIELLTRTLRPSCVINVNSHACWESFKTRGAVMSRHSKLYGAAFCRDYDSHGRPMGYIDTHLRDSVEFLDGVLTDNDAIVDDITKSLCLPTNLVNKFSVLRQPITILSGENQSISPRNSSDFHILWASRFCAQKNIKLLKKIVMALPVGMQIHLWGRGSKADEADLVNFCVRHENCVYKGSYPKFSTIPLHEYDAFLYTSLWDGVPNVLLEAASYGLPIVAPDIGGIPELVSNETGWLIKQTNSADSYVAALRHIRSDQVEAQLRVRSMRERLATEYSSTSFEKAVAEKLAYFGVKYE